MVLVNAFQKGASIIEKHFTLDKFKGRKNNDHFHAMDYNDFLKLRKNISILKLINSHSLNREIFKAEKNQELMLEEAFMQTEKLKKF